MAIVPQAATQSLDPVLNLGRQLEELRSRHRTNKTAEELLRVAQLPPELTASYPAQLSGGMAQRAALALALACGPRLLLADEPTASLDNVAQAKVLERIVAACDEAAMALLLITHDLALLARHCSRVLVITDGRMRADSTVPELLEATDPELRDLVSAGRSLPKRGEA
jgi:ABC-type glutathione transport system ATPase component